jgi:hypothetical protein
MADATYFQRLASQDSSPNPNRDAEWEALLKRASKGGSTSTATASAKRTTEWPTKEEWIRQLREANGLPATASAKRTEVSDGLHKAGTALEEVADGVGRDAVNDFAYGVATVEHWFHKAHDDVKAVEKQIATDKKQLDTASAVRVTKAGYNLIPIVPSEEPGVNQVSQIHPLFASCRKSKAVAKYQVVGNGGAECFPNIVDVELTGAIMAECSGELVPVTNVTIAVCRDDGTPAFVCTRANGRDTRTGLTIADIADEVVNLRYAKLQEAEAKTEAMTEDTFVLSAQQLSALKACAEKATAVDNGYTVDITHISGAAQALVAAFRGPMALSIMHGDATRTLALRGDEDEPALVIHKDGDTMTATAYNPQNQFAAKVSQLQNACTKEILGPEAARGAFADTLATYTQFEDGPQRVVLHHEDDDTYTIMGQGSMLVPIAKADFSGEFYRYRLDRDKYRQWCRSEAGRGSIIYINVTAIIPGGRGGRLLGAMNVICEANDAPAEAGNISTYNTLVIAPLEQVTLYPGNTRKVDTVRPTYIDGGIRCSDLSIQPRVNDTQEVLAALFAEYMERKVFIGFVGRDSATLSAYLESIQNLSRSQMTQSARPRPREVNIMENIANTRGVPDLYTDAEDWDSIAARIRDSDENEIVGDRDTSQIVEIKGQLQQQDAFNIAYLLSTYGTGVIPCRQKVLMAASYKFEADVPVGCWYTNHDGEKAGTFVVDLAGLRSRYLEVCAQASEIKTSLGAYYSTTDVDVNNVLGANIECSPRNASYTFTLCDDVVADLEAEAVDTVCTVAGAQAPDISASADGTSLSLVSVRVCNQAQQPPSYSVLSSWE